MTLFIALAKRLKQLNARLARSDLVTVVGATLGLIVVGTGDKSRGQNLRYEGHLLKISSTHPGMGMPGSQEWFLRYGLPGRTPPLIPGVGT